MANIEFEGSDGRKKREVDDADLQYREDHWQVTLGDDNFLYIPRERVYRVRMNVPEVYND